MCVYVTYDDTLNVSVIRKQHTTHNHPFGPQEYRQYSDHRQPQGVLRQETMVLLEHGANATLVADTLNRQGVETRARDLYNMQRKLRVQGKLD